MKYLNCEIDDKEAVAFDDFDLRAAAAMAGDETPKTGKFDGLLEI